jgi:hypothetical protein
MKCRLGLFSVFIITIIIAVIGIFIKTKESSKINYTAENDSALDDCMNL